MSQFPPPPSYPPHAPSPYGGSPYQGYVATPPPFGGGGSTSAKRAALMQYILGPLAVLLGGCMAGFAVVLPQMPSSPQLDQAKAQFTANSGMPLDRAMRSLEIGGGLVIALGVALLVLAPFVRRGRRGGVITALVLAGLVELIQAVGLLGALVQIGTPQGMSAACYGVVTLTLFGLLIGWLIGALRTGPTATSADTAYQQYAAQWYQYQQAAQAYGGGSGYGAPAMPQTPLLPEQTDGPASPG